MPKNAREVWITGIGLISSLGEGPQAHFDALDAGRSGADTQAFAPYVVHALAAIDFDKQIPKKGDQRQMEPWQRIGTYAAGLALEDAGIKANADILARTDLVVAARGGERDLETDGAILTDMLRTPGSSTLVNERLMNGLRPTLFLAQLSNLLAGNISIVHGVTGSSRTLLGEEGAGVDAVRIAAARIAAGQSDVVLVGGSNNAERKDEIFLLELCGLPWKDGAVGVWERGSRGGLASGSMGAFLVLEARDHAQARGARARARLGPVMSAWTRRKPGAVVESLEGMLARTAQNLAPEGCVVVSGASGVEPATSEEQRFLVAHAELPVRASTSQVGHGMEAQFPMTLGLAVVALQRGRLFAGRDGSGFEKPFAGAVRQALVTCVGHWKGEGMALVEAVESGDGHGALH